MASLLPDPPLPPPPLVTAVCIPQSTRVETFKRIERLERPPLAKYRLARQLFDAVLDGSPWEWANSEAKIHPDRQQARQAGQLLLACRNYLKENSGARKAGFNSLALELRPGLVLPVMVHARLSSTDGERAVAYHLWRTPLTEKQERLAYSLVQRVLWRQAGCAGIPLEVVTAPYIKALGRRSARVLRAPKTAPATDDEIEQFANLFLREWDAYHKAHPTRRWAHNKR